MSYHLAMELTRSRSAAAVTPPASVDETPWDILLALHKHGQCELSLEKLGRLISVPDQVLNQRLAELEERRLITGVKNEVTNELRALLTLKGRRLLDQYLSATIELHAGTHR
jgi:DNA-binding HxlR family transcriptional regulator